MAMEHVNLNHQTLPPELFDRYSDLTYYPSVTGAITYELSVMFCIL